MTRKRRCKACGRATKGHRGPTGIGVCKMDLSGANGVEGESQGAGSQANARPAQSGAPSDSGTAAADNRGSHNVNSGSMAELGVQSSAGGMGPHRYSSIVGLAEGPPAWGAGAPVQPSGRRSSRSMSPVRQRNLADVPPFPGACGNRLDYRLDYRREHSCPPVVPSPVASQTGRRSVPPQAREQLWGASAHQLGNELPRPGFVRASSPRHLAAHMEYVRGADAYSRPAQCYESARAHDYLARNRYPEHSPPRNRYLDFSSPRPAPRYDFLGGPGQPGPGFSSIPRGAEHVPDRIRDLALNGEFVELGDLLPNCVSSSDYDELRTVIEQGGSISLRPGRSRRIINSSYQWLEAWTVYCLVVCSILGVAMFHEMCAYQLFVISLFARYKLAYVLMFDIRHRQLLGARRDMSFRSIDHQTFISFFDASALRATVRCSRCNSTDHTSSQCPFRVPGQEPDLPSRQRRDGGRGDRQGDRQSDRSDKSEVCYRFQEGRCKAGPKCGRKHVCISCGGPDGLWACTKCKSTKNPGSGPASSAGSKN